MVPQTSSAGTHCDRTPKHEREPPQRRALKQRALIALGLRVVQADRPSGIQLIEVDSNAGSPLAVSARRCRRSRNLRNSLCKESTDSNGHGLPRRWFRRLRLRALIAFGLRTVQADRPSGIQLIEVDSTLGSPFVTSAPRCRRSRNLRIACVRSRRTPACMDSPAPKRAAAAASARTTVTHGAASRPIPSKTCADRADRSTRPQKRPRVPRTLAGSSRRPRSHRIGAHRHK